MHPFKVRLVIRERDFEACRSDPLGGRCCPRTPHSTGRCYRPPPQHAPTDAYAHLLLHPANYNTPLRYRRTHTFAHPRVFNPDLSHAPTLIARPPTGAKISSRAPTTIPYDAFKCHVAFTRIRALEATAMEPSIHPDSDTYTLLYRFSATRQRRHLARRQRNHSHHKCRLSASMYRRSGRRSGRIS